jgi:RNA polymerase sigma-70 factor (ECF subfamily)
MIHRGTDALIRQCSTDNLVERARAGDGDAFAVLMSRHHSIIRRTAYAFLKNPEDAEDVVQDVALNVFRKLHTFEGNAAFSTWLTRIAINLSLMRLRQFRRSRLSSLQDLTDGAEAFFAPLADRAPGPEQQYRTSEIKQRLYKAISKLPSRLREAAIDQIYGEMTMIEAAQSRGLSVAAAKSRAYRARKILTATVRSQGSSPRLARKYC